MKRSSAWHPEARDLRAQGMKVADIATALERTVGAVQAAVRGVKCPVDHNRQYYDRVPPWLDEARQLRLQGTPIKMIAKLVGGGHEAVSRAVADIPVYLPSAAVKGRPRPPELVARSVATRLANHVPKPKAPPKPRFQRRAYVAPPAERRRRQIHHVIACDQRPPAPITLPRVSILEGVV